VNGKISFIGGNFMRILIETCKRRLCKWANVFIGDPDGEHGGGVIDWDF
jgi:hypothetical protein